jgi:hypothetical protein
MVGEYPQRMVNLMVEDRSTMLKLFESEVEREGGSAQMVVGDYLGNFSGDVISKNFWKQFCSRKREGSTISDVNVKTKYSLGQPDLELTLL